MFPAFRRSTTRRLWGQSHATMESAIAALAATLPPDATIAVIPEGPYVLAKASAPEMAIR